MLSVLTFLIFFAYGLRYYSQFVGLPDIEKGPRTDHTWDDFLEHCGVRSYLGNPIHAVTAFEEEYSHKTVVWEGRVKKVQEGFWSKNFMFIRMDPPQIIRDDFSDLALIFDVSLNAKVSKVDVGDRIEFESTLLSFGRRGSPHFGVLWDFNITAKHDTLPDPSSGRRRIIVFGSLPRGAFHSLSDLGKVLLPIEPPDENNGTKIINVKA